MTESILQNRIASWKRASLLVGAAGATLAALAGLAQGTAFFRGYLVAFVYWAGISLGSLGVSMIHNLTGGLWGETIGTFLQAKLRTVYLVPILFIPIALGQERIYPWAGESVQTHNSHANHFQEVYFGDTFFFGRCLFYFAVWLLLAFLISGKATQPKPGVSAIGLVVFVMTASFASIDWMMSLDPKWYSTMYPVIVLAGQGLTALALCLVSMFLLRQPSQPGPNGRPSKRFLDLGNMLLMFVLFWAYVSFAQFLIIWYANLPEEATWYLPRTKGVWGAVAVFLVLFHFFIPFVFLLSRQTKRETARLLYLCFVLLGVQFVNLLWLLVPSFGEGAFWIVMMSVVLSVAIGGFWMFVYLGNLSRLAVDLPGGKERAPNG